MKTSLTTSLSIIGILATGGVALATNTTVLGPTLSSAQGLAPALAVSADSTVPATVQSSDTSATLAIKDDVADGQNDVADGQNDEADGQNDEADGQNDEADDQNDEADDQNHDDGQDEDEGSDS